MILIGIGANLSHPDHGTPRHTCEAALTMLGAGDVAVLRQSRWYESAPVPSSSQPWFVNGVAELETSLEPADLLTLLHEIEAKFGRQRKRAGESRVLDLDLLDYHGRIMAPGGKGPVLPHPRLAGRAFVLLPLAELAPDWRHPMNGRRIKDLVADLSPAQKIAPLKN